jgi:hypothetical protein
MRLIIDGGGYATATDAFVHANHAAALRYDRLSGELAGCTAMAGDAASSADFAATYDAAAAEGVAALGEVVAAFTTLGRLTRASLVNHHEAERRSVLPGAQVYDGGPLPEESTYASVLPATPPSSLGGDPSSLPGELTWLLDQLESFVWPDADVGRLRSAAGTWRAAADGLAALVDHCDLAIAGLAGEESPEVPLAVDATRELKGGICDLADQYVAIATACDQYAAQVEEQRAALLDLLHDLLRDTVIIEGVGLALSVVTAGGTGLGATAVNAARLARAVPRLLELVALVRRAASAAADVLRLAAAAVGRVRVVLARYAGAVVAADARALTVAMPQVRLTVLTRIIRDPRAFDPEHLRGMRAADVRSLVRDWEAQPTRAGDGVRFLDPDSRGRSLRIMPGYPGTRPDSLTHGPYAVLSQNGTTVKIPLEGNLQP